MADNIKVEVMSGFWFCGWLFTWGFVKLTGWKIVWSIVIWAYYLGEYLRGVI